MIIYRVNKEDSIESIALKYKTTPQQIIETNRLKAKIMAGMRLFIPEYYGKPYTVQPYDTMDTIAKKFGIDKQELIIANKCERVFLGQKIFIPDCASMQKRQNNLNNEGNNK